MIYVTGDCHGDVRRFNFANFPDQHLMTKDDYVIILGDFGIIWSKEENKQERYWLDWLNDKTYTTLFIDGNHENHDRLDTYPVSEWKGGKVHFIRPNVIHLMRGQVYEIEDLKFFTMGGAPSHDIQDGIFDPADYASKEDLKAAIKKLTIRKGGWENALYRIKGIDWWEREVPNQKEWIEAYRNLKKHNFKVDYCLSHECPASAVPFVSIFAPTEMSKKLQNLYDLTDHKYTFFGHYHMDAYIPQKPGYECFFENIKRIQ